MSYEIPYWNIWLRNACLPRIKKSQAAAVVPHTKVIAQNTKGSSSEGRHSHWSKSKANWKRESTTATKEENFFHRSHLIGWHQIIPNRIDEDIIWRRSWLVSQVDISLEVPKIPKMTHILSIPNRFRTDVWKGKHHIRLQRLSGAGIEIAMGCPFFSIVCVSYRRSACLIPSRKLHFFVFFVPDSLWRQLLL